jgi:monoamine oxidase
VRIAVVGAGFAGLIAADRITRSGQQAVVLEARDRVIGRESGIPGAPDEVLALTR